VSWRRGSGSRASIIEKDGGTELVIYMDISAAEQEGMTAMPLFVITVVTTLRRCAVNKRFALALAVKKYRGRVKRRLRFFSLPLWQIGKIWKAEGMSLTDGVWGRQLLAEVWD